MGTSQQSFDIQKLFKNSPAPSPSPTPTPPSYNPYPHSPNPFPPQPSYPPPSSTFPSGMYPYLHYSQDNVRPSSYTPATFPQPPYQPAVAPLPQPSLSHAQSTVSSPPLDGARLMALLTTHSTGDLRESASLLSSLELPPPAVNSSSPGSSTVESSEPPPAISPALPTAPPVSLAPQSSLKTSGKLAKGRVLSGERVTYDVGASRGEDQPQLEVSTITVYCSDPIPLLGRQIAVNKTYICYGLRAGTIRVLNINTASRSLCKGHSQRVVDMAFVSGEVHTLASSSSEGRVFVRKILEGDQITDQILVGLQFTGDWNVVEPRVCWHSRPDVLVVGIGKYVLTVDIRKVRASEDPLECNVKKPIEGVSLLGAHENDVTSLAVCPGSNRFASSSKDGTVRLWAETELVVLAPHEMGPVYSVNFISAPRQDHVVMVTGGPQNRELKLFSPAGTDGLNWMCIQTLGFTSSGESEGEFFNQILTVPSASLVLLANAKKNAIYVAHLEFGQGASSTRMDFLAEFLVKIPILSFTATSNNLVDGEGVIQLYCIQTQAIQQHALDTAMCLPPPQEGAPLSSESFSPGPPPVQSSSKLLEKGEIGSPSSSSTEVKESEEKPLTDSDQIDKSILPDEALEAPKPELSDEEKEKKTPKLITPSDLMSMVARSKSEASASATDDEAKDVVSLDAGITDAMIDSFEDRSRGLIENCDAILDILESGDPDDADALIDSYGSHAFPEPEQEERTISDDISELKEVPVKPSDPSAASVSQSSAASKGRKNKNKASASVPPSAAASSSVEAETNGVSGLSSEGMPAQFQSMLEMMNQMLVSQKDMQKQLSATVPMAKRAETALGQRLEKIVKANAEASVAKLQEDNAKRDKGDRERFQQLMAAIGASSKELPAVLERVVKKELAAMGPSVAKLLSPGIEKAVSMALAESQVSASEKTLPQLEKAVTGKLEATVARHLQVQFQSTGRQALQESMRSCFEGFVVPSFERSCKSMFEQVDSAFQKGMAEHVSHAQQQSAANQNALASSVQESVSSLAQTLRAELAEGQRKLAAIAETRLKPGGPQEKVVQAMSLQHVEASLDPTIDLSRLVAQGKIEEAFNNALSLSDVTIVSWLCNQVDPVQVFSTTPLPLSQGVLLSLIQQLGIDVGNDTAKKLPWIQGAALALNPNDPILSGHMKPFLEQLYKNLHHVLMLTSAPSDLSNSLKLLCHLVNSLLLSCK